MFFLFKLKLQSSIKCLFLGGQVVIKKFEGQLVIKKFEGQVVTLRLKCINIQYWVHGLGVLNLSFIITELNITIFFLYK